MDTVPLVDLVSDESNTSGVSVVTSVLEDENMKYYDPQSTLAKGEKLFWFCEL